MQNEKNNIVSLDNERCEQLGAKHVVRRRTTNDEIEKRPLQREKPKPARFPVDSLLSLAAVVKAFASWIGCPVELIVQSVLSAVNYSVQAHADVHTGHGIRPISLFMLGSAESGERKTTVDNHVYGPISELEDRLRRELKDQSHDDEVRISPIVRITDPTTEGLIHHLGHSRGSCCVVNDDAASFLGSYAMAKENVANTLAKYSLAWDGKAIVSVRVGQNSRSCVDKRLSLSLMAQPIITSALLGSELARQQGFMSRIFICEPDSLIGKRAGSYRNRETAIELATRQKFLDRLREILREPLPIKEGTRNHLQPRVMLATEEALELIVAFYDETEVQCQKNGPLRPIKDFVAKAPEHALRVAATLALYDDINATHITPTYAQAGIEVVTWYMHEQLRLSGAEVDQELMQAQMLHDWLLTQPTNRVPLVACYQKGPNSLRKAATARRLMEILAEHGLVKLLPAPIEINGKLRHEVYEVL